MRVDEHLDGLRRAGERLSEAAAAAGPDAKVPSCPQWLVRDLVKHQGGVHRWARAGRRRSRPAVLDLLARAITTGHVGSQASASHFYLTLWNRQAPGGLAIDGDRDVLSLFADRVKVRWS